MARSDRGLYAVVAGGVVVGLGVALLYFAVLEPRSERNRVQAEIADWGERWDRTRACLVGHDPRSSDGFEALVLREALEPATVETHLARCDAAFRKLQRESEFTSGDAEIESAWGAVREPVRQLAVAHAWRVALEKPRPVADLRRALALAIEPVDQAYAALRAAAGLSPAPPPGPAPLDTFAPGGAPLAEPGGVPLMLREISLRPATIAAWAESGETRWLFRQTGPGEVALSPSGPSVLAALKLDDGGPAWGLWPELEFDRPPALHAGALDEHGDPFGDESVVVTLDAGVQLRPTFALGRGAERVAAFVVEDLERATTRWGVARSTDGGAAWGEPLTLPPGAVMRQDLAGGRVDFHWDDDDGLHWLELSPATLSAPLEPRLVVTAAELGPSSPRPCFAADAAWWFIDRGLHHIGRGATRASEIAGSRSSTTGAHVCDDGRLLAVTRPTTAGAPALRLVDCRADGCRKATEVPFAEGAQYSVLLGAAGPALAISTDGVLALWTGDPETGRALTPSRLVRLPGDQDLVGLVEWSGKVHALLFAGDGYRVTPLP